MRASQTVMAMDRGRDASTPKPVKTDGLRSYIEAIPRAFPLHAVEHAVSERFVGK